MKLVVTAPRGKMGKLIIEITAGREGIELVGAVAPAGRDYIGRDAGEVAGCGPVGAKVYGSIEEVIDNCDCVIDFSTVEEGMHILEVCRAKGVALVCGTTGFTPEQREAFATAGADIPVMLAANTSRMVNVMSKLLAQAASALHETAISKSSIITTLRNSTRQAVQLRNLARRSRRQSSLTLQSMLSTDAGQAGIQEGKARLASTHLGAEILHRAILYISWVRASALRLLTTPSTGNASHQVLSMRASG